MNPSSAPVPAGNDVETDPKLIAYYADKRLVFRNLCVVEMNVFAHAVGLGLAATLSNLHMRQCGIGVGTIALLNSINLWAVSYLVMYFSWRSDRTVSKWGRRTPYVLLSLPFVCICTALFPFFTNQWSLIILYAVKLLFMDMMLSTQPLLRIDCMPRRLLGRVNALGMVLGGIATFLVMRYGMAIAEVYPTLPFTAGAGVMAVITLTTCLTVKEPPIVYPATGPFLPWSALIIGMRDRRIFVLMLGVAMVGGFYAMFGYWNVFWATSTVGDGLGLSKAAYGSAFSWQALVVMTLALPCGWIIDRFSGYKVVSAMWILQLTGCALVLTMVHDAQSLMIVALMCAAGGTLFPAAEIMVFKSSNAADIGSVTSSLSLVRNAWAGTLIAISGLVVTLRGSDHPNYHGAFLLGMGVATLGLIWFGVYAWLMRRRVQAASTPLAPPIP